MSRRCRARGLRLHALQLVVGEQPGAERAEDFGRDLADDVLSGLYAEGVSETEAERLLDTVRTHLVGSGPIADTATALYCNRNTVQQRFIRFAELTGRDPRRPWTQPWWPSPCEPTVGTPQTLRPPPVPRLLPPRRLRPAGAGATIGAAYGSPSAGRRRSPADLSHRRRVPGIAPPVTSSLADEARSSSPRPWTARSTA